MRIHRLYLRNYRVFEELDLEMPAGLVGIYGPNGAGKSSLLEAILFALWGQARTQNPEVRTSGVNAECVAEVTFEQDGHYYQARRTLSGQAARARAELLADGLLVAETSRETARYLHSLLGMDQESFRASVFAEQKQVDALSSQQPNQRQALVLGLLGVTPLDQARSAARKEASMTEQAHAKASAALGDLDALRQRKQEAEQAAELASERRQQTAAQEEEARCAAQQAEATYRRLEAQEAAYRRAHQDRQRWRRQAEDARQQLEELAKEAAELEQAAAELASLGTEPADVEPVQQALLVLSELETARAQVAGAPQPVPPEPLNDKALAQAQERAEAAAQARAKAEADLGSAKRALERARSELDQATGLSDQARCPLCGQELGSAFQQVVSHRQAELEAARAELEARKAEAAKRRDLAEQAASEWKRAQADRERLVAEWARYEQAKSSAEQARALLAQAEREAASLGVLALISTNEEVAVAQARPDQLRRELELRSQLATRRSRLEGRLSGRARLEDQQTRERQRLAEAEEALAGLEAELAACPSVATELEAARQRAEQAGRAATQAAQLARQAGEQAAAAQATLDEAIGALQRAEDQRRELDRLQEEARHRWRVAGLLDSFRDSVVAAIGPALSAGASRLFSELTDHEYDGLELDPESYEIRIWDQGVAHGIRRYSGSETDLANLSVRVAISEHIGLLHGGRVGLLVLDEVFGPLDEARKDRMLVALERLRGRFDQILVVTHDEVIKEQLPVALEVRKLPGRRAAVELA